MQQQRTPICMAVNNFFPLVSIVSGLNMRPISRRKKTWEGLVDEHKNDVDGSRAIDRTHAKLETALGPSCDVITTNAIYLKDLIFMNDRSKSKVRGSINFDALRMMATRVEDIANLVPVEYPHQPIPTNQNYLARSVVERSHAKLKEMSLECEKL
ncbi:hypothetical protein HK097_009535 [Rhizophlyctis rosea]|uniref:Ras-GEF domain-containing protein n=1 Tax=Rhizophlyctis rosea TaxID=64517 RepID=A0AAD5X3R0_9FUNG|nr:hypothetical protein HK097_009535 [Rhizophlyctis rosea]